MQRNQPPKLTALGPNASFESANLEIVPNAGETRDIRSRYEPGSLKERPFSELPVERADSRDLQRVRGEALTRDGNGLSVLHRGANIRCGDFKRKLENGRRNWDVTCRTFNGGYVSHRYFPSKWRFSSPWGAFTAPLRAIAGKGKAGRKQFFAAVLGDDPSDIGQMP